MTGGRRALLLLPALAACYAYAPSRWEADPTGRWAYRPPPRTEPTSPRAAARADPRDDPPPRAPGDDPPNPLDAQPEPTAEIDRAADPPLGDADEVRRRIVEVARRYLGHRYAGDCSDYVRRVLREAGVALPPLPSAGSMSESLHLASRDVAAPQPGDLIFFHDTWDRNHDGRLGDRWTHVALVEAVEGTRVWILHRGGKGIIRLVMDRSRPHDERANDPVRMRTPRDPPGTRYLTGELFAAYGDPLEERP